MSGLRRFLRRWALPPLGEPWTIPADRNQFPVFLLMGQSNMAGHGCISDDDPWQAGDLAPVPQVLVLGGQGTAKSRRPRGWIRWRPAAHPLHLNQNSGGFGLGLPFAKRLLEDNSGLTIGLVPCAWGGAAIDLLGAGSPLYDNAVRRARIAANSGTLAGVLWHQGESDTRTDPLARSHAEKLGRLIDRLRFDLAEPQLPFLIGDLGAFGDERRKPDAVARQSVLRSGLRDVAHSVPHSAFIESDGLTGTDSVHFDRASLVEFGRRYAEAYRNGTL